MPNLVGKFSNNDPVIRSPASDSTGAGYVTMASVPCEPYAKLLVNELLPPDPLHTILYLAPNKTQFVIIMTAASSNWI
ncbi:hypothetical protein QE152_g1793 [Popillia japonica]|uniref:Uncharacterized protein n=1 Tax=Popillia japonica TaxID=7064 RepID=A0AAW1N3I5_POPJA